MPLPTRRTLTIACRWLALAALTAAAPIALVWLGTITAEAQIKAGNLSRAERLVSVCGTLSASPLMPGLAVARVHGARCEIAVKRGKKTEAMDHFLLELEILMGRPIVGVAPPREFETPPGLAYLEFRKDLDAWRRGYWQWAESFPASPPDFDREFLSPAFDGRAHEYWKSDEPLPKEPGLLEGEVPSSLRDLYSQAKRGDAPEEPRLFLEGNLPYLEQAREWADRFGTSEDAPVSTELASDAFRVLLLDFVHQANLDAGTGGLEALGRCGRMLRKMEEHPSVAAVLVSFSLRSDWLLVVERIADRFGAMPEIQQAYAKELTLFAFDPGIPAKGLRRDYAFYREMFSETYLGGDWETAAPLNRRRFVRQIELLHGRFQKWAIALSPETSPDLSSRLVSELAAEEGSEATLLAARPHFAELFYGSRKLTEEDGRRYGEAVDTCAVAGVDGIGRLRLGRFDESIRELRANETRLIEKLSSGKAGSGH